LVHAAGPDGIAKIVDKFLAIYSNISKRQTETKINEVAFKAKLENDKAIRWHLRPEFEKYLNMDRDTLLKAMASSNVTGSLKPAAVVKKTKATASKAAGKTKAAASSTSTSGNKRKMEDNPAETTEVPLAEPKKFKRAFAFFVKDKRPEAERNLGEDASVFLFEYYLFNSFDGYLIFFSFSSKRTH
jgi:hypothetical protein